METIVVNDTNIFLDLLNANLLDVAFRLPIKFHTTEFVLNEIIIKEQRSLVDKLIKDGRLTVKEFDVEEVERVEEINSKNTNNLSFTDCSVWYLAKSYECRLLTGDRKLRYTARNDGVLVSGTLYITDKIEEYHLMDLSVLGEHMEKLYQSNDRLPKDEIMIRIERYKGSI